MPSIFQVGKGIFMIRVVEIPKIDRKPISHKNQDSQFLIGVQKQKRLAMIKNILKRKELGLRDMCDFECQELFGFKRFDFMLYLNQKQQKVVLNSWIARQEVDHQAIIEGTYNDQEEEEEKKPV